MTLLARENIHTKIAMDNVIAEFGCRWDTPTCFYHYANICNLKLRVSS